MNLSDTTIMRSCYTDLFKNIIQNIFHWLLEPWKQRSPEERRIEKAKRGTNTEKSVYSSAVVGLKRFLKHWILKDS